MKGAIKIILVFTFCLFWTSAGAEVEFTPHSDCANNCQVASKVCGQTGSTKGALTVAQTVSSALQKLIDAAQANLLAIEGSLCSSELKPELFKPTNEGDVEAPSDCAGVQKGSLCSSELKSELSKPTNEGYVEVPSDCAGVQEQLGNKTNGVYRIWPKYLNRSINVYCDMSTDNGGWTVIVRRDDYPKQQDFYLNMEDYSKGFGDVSKDFWIGNDVMFAMTNEKENVLRFEVEDFDGNRRFAQYKTFIVDSRIRQYKLTVGGFSGDAGDSFSIHNGAVFNAKDTSSELGVHCAQLYNGAWWYVQRHYCHSVQLTGMYLRGSHTSHANGVHWLAFKGWKYSLKFAEMKIRPLSFKGLL